MIRYFDNLNNNPVLTYIKIPISGIGNSQISTADFSVFIDQHIFNIKMRIINPTSMSFRATLDKEFLPSNRHEDLNRKKIVEQNTIQKWL